MPRVLHFSDQFSMGISDETAEPIPRSVSLLHEIPPVHFFEKFFKPPLVGYDYPTYLKVGEYQLFQPLFPLIARHFTLNHATKMKRMLVHGLKNIDRCLQITE